MFFDGAVVYDNQATACLLFSPCIDPNITRIIYIYTGYQAVSFRDAKDCYLLATTRAAKCHKKNQQGWEYIFWGLITWFGMFLGGFLINKNKRKWVLKWPQEWNKYSGGACKQGFFGVPSI